MSWRVVKIGELIENFSVKAKDFNVDVSTLDFFGVSNTEGITNSKYAAEGKANDYKIMEKGCFAYNPYRVNVGSIAMLKDDIIGLISPAYVVFKVKKNTIIPELLLKFLKSAEGLRQIKLHARGTVRQALRFSDLCQIKISLPDYDEQIEFYKKISNTEIESSVLSIELTHQLDLVKKLRQSFLREAMQGKLIAQNPNDEPATELLAKIKAEKERLIKEKKIRKPKPLPPITKDEIPFEIPENWVWCRLGNACLKITDGTHHSPLNLPNGDFMYVTAKNIKNNGIDLSNITYISKYIHNEIYARCNPEFGDILYIKDGATTGIVTINNLKEEFSLLSSVALLKIDENIYNRFLMYVMRSPVYYEVTRSNMYGVALTRVTLTKINSSIIPLPPLSEQKRIVAKLDELMAYCDSLEASIKNSQTQNEMLLGQVLREALKPKEITIKEEVL